jgi:hypothetical protein
MTDLKVSVTASIGMQAGMQARHRMPPLQFGLLLLGFLPVLAESGGPLFRRNLTNLSIGAVDAA